MTKLFIVAQDRVFMPQTPIATAISPDLLSGDSIAEKYGYSELRAHYWVWKNEPKSTDRIGLFQFRRYLDLSGTRVRGPYSIRKFPTAKDVSLENLKDCDIVAPLPEYTGKPVFSHYCAAHRTCDLRLIREIIQNVAPEYRSAADTYLNGKQEYYCNLYIMRRSIFDAYCQWLFDILTEFDRRVVDPPPRVQGYLAERLFGIWFTRHKNDADYTWTEIPRVHFWGYDDERHHLRREMVVNFFLPPGTSIRAAVRGAVKRI